MLILSLSTSFSETDLRQLENSAQIFNALSDIPGDIDDVDQLFNVYFFYSIHNCYKILLII